MKRAAFAACLALACVPHAFAITATCAPLFACGGRAFTAPELLDAGSDVGSDVGSDLLDAGAGDASDGMPPCVPKTWDPRPCATSPSYAPHGWPFACGPVEGFDGFCCTTPDATCRDAGHD